MSLFETYQPNNKRKQNQNADVELDIRQASDSDAQAIAQLTAERNGGLLSDYFNRIVTELSINSDVNQLFVAKIDSTNIVGFARCSLLSAAQPSGWYLSGTIVAPKHRGCGIASILTHERLKWLDQKTENVYSFCNAQNLVSIKLHQRFHFIEIARGPSFAGTTFSGGEGILFCRSKKQT